MALPRFVVFMSKPTQRYLCYNDADVNHGFIYASGREIVSPYAKFEVEMATSGRGLVHVRSCYNNKYWVRWSKNHFHIAAHADEPEEDQSKWSCTLFEPISVASGGVRLRHVQLGHYAAVMGTFSTEMALFARSFAPDVTELDIFTIKDWESILIFPKRIAFKGDNDLYLSARTIERFPYLQFASEDIGDRTVGNEVFTNPDGSIRIKSNHFGRFWRRSPNWIWADSDDTTDRNPDTVFVPVKVDSNVVALRNMGNNTFCTRLTTEGKTSCLNANASTINQWARLVVEELVILRSIYNVEFRLMDARIYGHNVVNMATGEATNMTPEPNTVALTLSYTDTRASTWSSSVSLMLGVKTSITTGIPLIAEGKIEISAQFTGAYEWGETNTSSSTVETVFTATVPPMSMVRVSLLATRASCDVPFTYVRRDTLMDGTQTTQTMNDGIYTASNTYDFRYESRHQELQ